jgi:hypothetical protein
MMETGFTDGGGGGKRCVVPYLPLAMQHTSGHADSDALIGLTGYR